MAIGITMAMAAAKAVGKSLLKKVASKGVKVAAKKLVPKIISPSIADTGKTVYNAVSPVKKSVDKARKVRKKTKLSKDARKKIREAKRAYRKAKKEIRIVKDELKTAHKIITDPVGFAKDKVVEQAISNLPDDIREKIEKGKKVLEFVNDPVRITNQTVREEIARRKKNIRQSQTTAEKLIRDLEARGYSVSNRDAILKGPKNIYGANFTSYLNISDPEKIKSEAVRSGIPRKTAGNISAYYDTVASDLIYSLDKMPSDRRGRMAFELITMSDESKIDITAGLPDGINFYNFLSKKSIIQNFQKNVDKDTLIKALKKYEKKDPEAFNEMLDFLYNETRAAYEEQYEELRADRKAKASSTLRQNHWLVGDFSDSQMDKLMDLFETPEWTALKNNWKQFEEWYSKQAFDELVRVIKTEGVYFDVDKFASLVASHGDLMDSVDTYIKIRTKGDE